jgi:hypothetical protein
MFLSCLSETRICRKINENKFWRCCLVVIGTIYSSTVYVWYAVCTVCSVCGILLVLSLCKSKRDLLSHFQKRKECLVGTSTVFEVPWCTIFLRYSFEVYFGPIRTGLKRIQFKRGHFKMKTKPKNNSHKCNKHDSFLKVFTTTFRFTIEFL